MPRAPLILALVLGVAGTVALAQTDVTTVTTERLGREGFTVYQISRTWLGRILIEAESPGFRREVVLNRATGEVLRDRTIARDAGDGPSEALRPDAPDGGEGPEGEGGGRGGDGPAGPDN